MKKLFSVLQEDLGYCFVTGSTNVCIHHIFGASNRKRSESYGFVVAIEPRLHNMHKGSIHDNPNKGLDLKLKQMAQTYYESHIGNREDFISEFGKSWL